MRAISRNTRRRIRVDGRDYHWWIYEEWEDRGPVTLAVASADKRFLVRYAINQPDNHRYLTFMGRELGGLPEGQNGGWTKVRCPALTMRDAVGPSDVRRLIEWCLRPKADLVQLDWEAW
jgi:hypothetical protein